MSALCGESVVYQIAGEESRAILANQEKGSEVLVSKATVLNEYLVTVKVSYFWFILISFILKLHFVK